eukprot:CAMPEP_0198141634 /NCGR_PEP_ID=MMETSP1443-20131203/4612_1 /TAXON_ID=186043 /ORGANISM="Entomoneis sp., Strain CCMP2396" /LENGTH=185 /DNA_ID=CAMNT_0043804441 /DNA_START=322 /DNA_END=879 /DNA_ORIENTATION=-
MKILGDREEVPPGKQNMISTRENSDYKWQQTRGVIGALEIPSVPDLVLEGEYTPRYVDRKEPVFEEALDLWHARKLRAEFLKACNNVPLASFCCGMLPDQDQWIKNIVKSLNKGWIKAINQKLKSERRDVYLDVYLWSWHNATGKSTTSILLVRFFESQRKSIMLGGLKESSQRSTEEEKDEEKE